MHRFRLAALVALVPCALAAQQAAPAPAPQASANPITDSFKAFHTRYSGWLVAAFDSIPAAKYGFKPTPAQMSVGNIAQHLESANYQLCSAFSGMPWNKTEKDAAPDSVKAMWPKDTLSARLKASFAYCEQAFAKVTDANLAEQLPAGPPGSGRTTPRARLVLVYDGDLVDHYSQMANYMRAMGMLPPSAMRRGM